MELGGGDSWDSGTNFSNNWSSLSDDRGSSNSRGSDSVDSSNSRGSNGADSRCSHNRGSSYCADSSNSRCSIATCIGIGVTKSTASIGTIGTIVESISIGISTDTSNQGRDYNLEIILVIYSEL